MEAPERRRAHLGAARAPLRDAVAERAHVVEQEVGEGLERPEAEGLYGARARDQCADVAVRTADVVEDAAAAELREAEARAWRRGEESHEVVEQRDVRAVVLRVGDGITGEQRAVALRAILVREERARDAHLVQVGVAGEVKEVRYLAFPAELPDRPLSGHDVGDDVRAPGGGGLPPSLDRGERQQRDRRHGIHEAEAKQRRGPPSGADGRLRGDLLADERARALCPDALVLDERAAVRRHRIERARGGLAEARLDERAPAARATDVVTRGARVAVEHGTEPVRHGLDLLERVAPGGEARELVDREAAHGVAELGPRGRPEQYHRRGHPCPRRASYRRHGSTSAPGRWQRPCQKTRAARRDAHAPPIMPVDRVRCAVRWRPARHLRRGDRIARTGLTAPISVVTVARAIGPSSVRRVVRWSRQSSPTARSSAGVSCCLHRQYASRGTGRGPRAGCRGRACPRGGPETTDDGSCRRSSTR